MSKKHRKFFKKSISYLLAVVLCINTVFYSMASTGSQMRSNAMTTEDGTLEITPDSIIIDGNTYTKAQFTQALQQLKKLTKQQNPTLNNVQPGNLRSTLAFVGIGLAGVFAIIAFTLAMSDLFPSVKGIEYVLPVGAFPGLSRPISIQIIDTSSIIFCGVRVGANWATMKIVEYLAANHASIEEVTEEEGDGETDEDEALTQGQPRDKHKVETGRSLPDKGEPDSSADLLNPDGTVKQRRYYGKDGRAEVDIDFNHSDDGTHTFPHRHTWDWNKVPPRQDSR